MIKVFQNIRGKCVVCDTPVDGRYEYHNKLYCAADYQRVSVSEKENNRKLKENKEDYDNFISKLQ